MIILYWRMNVLCLFDLTVMTEGAGVLNVTNYVLVTSMPIEGLKECQ
jgi:hypothetical protein